MKKIIYLISSLKSNGPNRVLLSMIDGIDKSIYEIYVVSFLNNNDLNFVNEIESKVKKVYLINFNSKVEIITKGRRRIQSIVDSINPDVIHSHGILPDIVNSKIKTSAKTIATIHNNMFEDYIYSFGKLRGKLFGKWHLHYLKKINKCVCCSKSVYDVLSRVLYNISYVQNSVFKFEDIANYYDKRKNIREKYSIPESAVVFIYAGVLSEGKNVKDLVLKFNKYLNENEYLLILGIGPLGDEIKSLKNNSNIIFCGFNKNVCDFYCASDVYCSFSLSEGFSISILEALEYNNLLLLDDIPSHREIFEIGKRYYLGEIFNNFNFKQRKEFVVHALVDFKSSREILIEHLNCINMMKKYEKIYEEV